MPDLATSEPLSFRAGDFLTWEKELDQYRADQGWSLTYYLIKRTGRINITATASGAKHLVSVAATVTAMYAPGQYSWLSRVTKVTEIYSVGTGLVEILPNLALLDTHDFRSHARTMLEAIEAAFENRASATQLEYEIHGRRIQFMSPEALIQWRSFYHNEVAKEDMAAELARTGINPRRIGVRFVRV